MKHTLTSVTIFMMLLIGSAFQSVSAQTKADIFNEASTITWLGLDFSATKFIGTATQMGDAGEVTNAQFRDKFIPGWNNLFINEMKKYNVADAVHRTEVKYAIDVTEDANSKLNKDFFSTKTEDHTTLDETKVAALVKKYNFQKNEGIGMMFFVESMSKMNTETSAWVTFVDMKSKSVLLTVRETGKVAGFGFKNYWAKGFWNILKSVDSHYKKWKG